MIDTLAIVASGVTEGWGVVRYAGPAPPHPARAALSLDAAFVNGTPARRFSVTVPLPVGLRATFSLPAPVLYPP